MCSCSVVRLCVVWVVCGVCVCLCVVVSVFGVYMCIRDLRVSCLCVFVCACVVL